MVRQSERDMHGASAEITIRYKGEKRTFGVTGTRFKELVGILSRVPTNSRSWRHTPAETVSDIKKLYREGWSMAAIAVEKGMTYTAVYSLLMRLRQFQPKPNFNDEQKQQIVSEFYEGETVAQLAIKYECSRTAIYKWLKDSRCSDNDIRKASTK